MSRARIDAARGHGERLEPGRHRASCRSPTRPATELPLARLLRLSLFQVSVGMAAVLLIGTLNRVMIVELGVPAWLVAADGRAAAAVRAVPRADRLPLRHAPLACSAGGACPTSGSARCCSSAAWRSCRSRCSCCPATAPGPRSVGAVVRRARLPAGRRGHAHHADRRPGAGHRPRARRRTAARGGAALRDAAGRHGGQRARLRRAAADFTPTQLVQVVQGAAVADDGAQPRRAVEAGAAQPARLPSPDRAAPPLPRGLGALHRAAAHAGGCWSPSASAPRPSACRTCCSSPMAARSWACRSARPRALTGAVGAAARSPASRSRRAARQRRRSAPPGRARRASSASPPSCCVIFAAPLAVGRAVRASAPR